MADSISRFNKSRPCPVCGTGTKNCSRTGDGLHFCRADAPADPAAWREIGRDDQGFTHYRAASDPLPGRPGTPSAPAPTLKPARPATDWAAAAATHRRNLSPEGRAELASHLRLIPEMLAAFPDIGANCGSAWTFPERDGRGRVVGIFLRRRDGGKDFVAGGNRGLAIPATWRDAPGPLLIVEGHSDTIALAGCGLAAVGRPSNTGGVEDLAELLRDGPAGREIVVVGENDEHKDKSGNLIWPGRDGAVRTAAALARQLGRLVRVALPPSGSKDSRAWVADRLADCGEAVDLAAIGREFVAALVPLDGGGGEDSPAAADPPASTAPAGWTCRPIEFREFMSGDYRPRWAVKRLMVLNEPMIVAAPSKSLKTSLMVDATVSLATGTSFLGHFEVPRPLRVYFISGESGEHTLQETFRRVFAAKRLDPLGEIAGNISLQFDLPKLATAQHLAELARGLAEHRADVLILDPAYLCLLAGVAEVDARSLFEMGEQLRLVTEVCRASGTTPVIVHHSNASVQVGSTMELSGIAFAGFQQFAAQWILLSRIKAYRGDGEHHIRMNAGGRAGQGGLFDLHVSEGTLADDFGGRRWDVRVASLDESRAEAETERSAVKSERLVKHLKADEVKLLDGIDKFRARKPAWPAATVNGLAGELTGLNTDKVKATAQRLIEEGVIELHCFPNPNHRGKGKPQEFKGYRRRENAPENLFENSTTPPHSKGGVDNNSQADTCSTTPPHSKGGVVYTEKTFESSDLGDHPTTPPHSKGGVVCRGGGVPADQASPPPHHPDSDPLRGSGRSRGGGVRGRDRAGGPPDSPDGLTSSGHPVTGSDSNGVENSPHDPMIAESASPSSSESAAPRKPKPNRKRS